ncbi:hypothetical protein G6F32_017067 [Rhizopus arrhizus]|nr:hypothetical protein G6F32_017067 [Rhizopus arrhizus]
MAIAFRDAGGGAGHHGQFARLGVAGQLRAVEQPLPDVAARRFFAQHHHGFWQAPGPVAPACRKGASSKRAAKAGGTASTAASNRS